MKNGIAPRSDGLTTEFYQLFWAGTEKQSKQKEYVEYCFNIGLVLSTQQRSTIALPHRAKASTRKPHNLEKHNPLKRRV